MEDILLYVIYFYCFISLRIVWYIFVLYYIQLFLFNKIFNFLVVQGNFYYDNKLRNKYK